MLNRDAVDIYAKRPRLSLRNNFAWSFIGNVIYAVCQWALLIVLARASGAEAVGVFAFAIAIVTPVYMLSGLQLRVVLVTDSDPGVRFQHFIALRMATTLLSMATIALIGGLATNSKSAFFVVFLIGLGKGCDAITDMLSGPFQRAEQLDRPAQIYALNGVLSLGFLVISLLSTDSLVAAAAAWALASIVAMTLAFLLTRKLLKGNSDLAYDPLQSRAVDVIRPDWDANVLRPLVRRALPLGVVLLFISLTTSVPRYVLERDAKISDLGIFAGIASLILAGDVVIRALWQSALPRLTTLYDDLKVTEFTVLTGKLCAIGLACGSAGLVISLAFGDRAIRIAYGDEFGGHQSVLVMLAAAASLLFVSSFLGAAMVAAKRYTIQAPIFAFLLAITATLSVLLIPSRGIDGAALTVLLSSVIQLLLSIAVVAWIVQSMRRMAIEP